MANHHFEKKTTTHNVAITIADSGKIRDKSNGRAKSQSRSEKEDSECETSNIDNPLIVVESENDKKQTATLK
jgi:hypothetical protein